VNSKKISRRIIDTLKISAHDKLHILVSLKPKRNVEIRLKELPKKY
jgi:hypothetical protein